MSNDSEQPRRSKDLLHNGTQHDERSDNQFTSEHDAAKRFDPIVRSILQWPSIMLLVVYKHQQQEHKSPVWK